MTKKILIEEVDGSINFDNQGFTRMEIVGILKTYLEIVVEQTKPILIDNNKNKNK